MGKVGRIDGFDELVERLSEGDEEGVTLEDRVEESSNKYMDKHRIEHRVKLSSPKSKSQGRVKSTTIQYNMQIRQANQSIKTTMSQDQEIKKPSLITKHSL